MYNYPGSYFHPRDYFRTYGPIKIHPITDFFMAVSCAISLINLLWLLFPIHSVHGKTRRFYRSATNFINLVWLFVYSLLMFMQQSVPVAFHQCCGSGAFLTPGSGIGLFRIPDLGSRIPNPYF